MYRGIIAVSALLILILTGCGSDNPTEPTPNTPSPPTANLLVSMKFEGNASDASGGGNDGTLMGGATANGTLIIGQNDTDALSLPHTVVDGMTDFTFAAWLKINQFNSGSNQWISGANAAEDNAIAFWYNHNDNRWIIAINDVYFEFDQNVAIEDKGWHHVAVTRAGDMARLYVDGSAVGGAISISADALDVDPGGFIIGRDQDSVGGGFSAGDSWAGEIDNLRIYGRALSASEILALKSEAR